MRIVLSVPHGESVFATLNDRLRNMGPVLLHAGKRVSDEAKAHITAHGTDLGAFGVEWAPTKYPWAVGFGGGIFQAIVRHNKGPRRGRTPYNTPHPILIWTGHLRGSMDAELNSDGRSVIAGTNVKTQSGKYNLGQILQEGSSRGMPPRPFIYIDEHDQRWIRESIAGWIAKGEV